MRGTITNRHVVLYAFTIIAEAPFHALRYVEIFNNNPGRDDSFQQALSPSLRPSVFSPQMGFWRTTTGR